MKTALHTRTTVTVSTSQLASNIGGETVILGLNGGRYYGLDDVGARIWQLIQQPTEVRAIADTLVREYEVGRERCEADVVALLEKMIAAGLVEVVPGTSE